MTMTFLMILIFTTAYGLMVDNFAYNHIQFSDEMSAGLDDLLSKHMAHLFIRDPLVIFSELVDQDDTTSMDHFEVLEQDFYFL